MAAIIDAGIDTVVISPFTFFFAEAIITAKNNSDLTEDLILEQGS